MNTKKMTLTAMFAALVFVATFFLKIPSQTGYLNCGDMMIFIAAFLLGEKAAFPAAFGSAAADIIGGYTVYIPATIVIKGGMGLIAGILLRKKTEATPFVTFFISCAIGETVMASGYFVYECAVFGAGAALGNIPLNLFQCAIGLSTALFRPALVRLKSKMNELT
jgi:uncharacterized membrane protein